MLSRLLIIIAASIDFLYLEMYN